MKRKIDWLQFDQFLTMITGLWTMVKAEFTNRKIGPEILEWINGPGRVYFQNELLPTLSEEYLRHREREEKEAIVAPQGARIHTVRVKVKLDRPWQEAVNAAGPNTPDDYNVRKVGDKYPPTGTEEVEEELVMINYPKGDGYDAALAWAKTQGLENTVPREVFAIGEQHPGLHIELGLNPMYAVATTECIFGGDRLACCVWWDDSDREANLGWVSYFGLADGWFVFRKLKL